MDVQSSVIEEFLGFDIIVLQWSVLSGHHLLVY